MHLVSLPPLTESSLKIIRDLWKWKDIVLGDGRDYFVPRPRALKALSDAFVGRVWTYDTLDLESVEGDTSFKVEECCILSNCARMDILLAVSHPLVSSNIRTDWNSTHMAHEAAISIAAASLESQLNTYQMQKQKSSNPLWEGIASKLDLPGLVQTESTLPSNLLSSTCESSTRDLIKSFQPHSQSDPASILMHYCLIAAGLAPRPSRPGRTIQFRPFSSRDAHILLQLKRTSTTFGSYPLMKIVLDTALSAGKVARDPDKISILEELRGMDGEGRFRRAAPSDLAQRAAETVTQDGIVPLVQKGLERLGGIHAKERVKELRNKAEGILLEVKGITFDDGGKAASTVKKLLHEPCIKIRKGTVVDENDVLIQIRNALGE
jgi:hypothetical protein